MPPRLRNLAIAACAIGALALAGCGGGGGGDTTAAAPVETTETAPTLTKDELIAQGDAICAEVNAAVGTVNAGEAEVSAQVSQAADLYSGMVERLQALGTPDEAQGYEAFSNAAEELAQSESDAQLAAARGDEEGLANAQSSASSALASFQEAASAYGFKDCSEAPSRAGSESHARRQRRRRRRRSGSRARRSGSRRRSGARRRSRSRKKSRPKPAAPAAPPKAAAPAPAAAKKAAAPPAASAPAGSAQVSAGFARARGLEPVVLTCQWVKRRTVRPAATCVWSRSRSLVWRGCGGSAGRPFDTGRARASGSRLRIR